MCKLRHCIHISLFVITNTLLGSNNLVFGQASTPGGSVRLTVLSGGNVEFIFNSMKDYNLGITLSNWTKLGITVRDEPGDINPVIPGPDGIDDYTQWQLDFQALDQGPVFGSINGIGANLIPFNSIEVKATSAAGCGTCFFNGSPFIALTAAAQTLVDGSLGGADQIEDFPSAENLVYASDQINISYRCGNGGSLFGKPADYYSDGVVFTLTMSP